MKLFRFLLLLCLPAFLLAPIPSYSFEPTYYLETGHKLFIPRDKNGLINPWGYFNPRTILTHLDGYADHVFGFIDLLSDLDFLESLSDEEAVRLIDFVIFIVRFSVPKSRPDLAEKYEQEIAELLEFMYGDDDEYQLLSAHDSHWDFSPAICHEKPEFILCKKKKKGWFERKWHHFTHWCDKNKEPLIAVAVVAGVATIAALTGGLGAGATAAVGGALAGATAIDDTPQQINKPGEVHFHDDPPTYSPPQNDAITTLPSRDFHPSASTTPAPDPTQSLEEMPLVVQQSVEDAKEDFTKEPAKQKPKKFVSYMGHQILDELSTYGLEHVVGEEAIDAGHEVIDRAFGTDYASDYTTEMKEQVASLKEDFGLTMATGELPPPTTSAGAVAKTGTAIGSALVAQEALSGASAAGGTLTNADPNPSQNTNCIAKDLSIDRLAEAGKEPDRGELTRAGRALAKHGSRPDSVFPQPTGTPSQINDQGQAFLERILKNPNKNVIKLPSGNIKIYNELGQGAHFTGDGKFIGFIEAQDEQKN